MYFEYRTSRTSKYNKPPPPPPPEIATAKLFGVLESVSSYGGGGNWCSKIARRTTAGNTLSDGGTLQTRSTEIKTSKRIALPESRWDDMVMFHNILGIYFIAHRFVLCFRTTQMERWGTLAHSLVGLPLQPAHHGSIIPGECHPLPSSACSIWCSRRRDGHGAALSSRSSTSYTPGMGC